MRDMERLLSVENVITEKIKEILKHVPGGKYHDHTALAHTIMVANAIKTAASGITKEKKKLLEISAYLHDVGKGLTGGSQHSENSEAITFHGHEKVGAEWFMNYAKDIDLTKKEKEIINFLISSHMKAHNITKDNSIIKLANEAKLLDAFELLCILQEADQSCGGYNKNAPSFKERHKVAVWKTTAAANRRELKTNLSKKVQKEFGLKEIKPFFKWFVELKIELFSNKQILEVIEKYKKLKSVEKGAAK